MSTFNPAQPPPLYDVLQALKSEIFKTLRVCLPATITKVHSVGGAVTSVDAQPAVLLTIPQAGNSVGQSIPYPQLLNCPVVTIQGGGTVGGVAAAFPIAIGDSCLVFFADRCMDAWKQNGTPALIPNIRMHDLSDGFALVGINFPAKPLKVSLSAGEGGLCETVASAGSGAKVVINPVTHKIKVANTTKNLETTLQLLIIGILGMTSGGNPMVDATGSIAIAATDLAELLY